VADQGPAWLAVDERETLQSILQFQRESVVRKVEGLDDDAARRRLVDSDTTLLWLVKHLAFAESIWVEQRFAGGAMSVPMDQSLQADDTHPAAIETYRAMWARVDAITATASLDDLCRDIGDRPPVNLRWVLMHLLEETARHAGHADILRELIDGDTGR